MDKIEFYKKYCTGCGLCKSVRNIDFESKNGFDWPILQQNDLDFCDNYCPVNGKYNSELSGEIFGSYKSIYHGWSTNKKIRYKASSGGMITEICDFLLDTKKVDYIIQIGTNPNIPYKTKICIADSVQSVFECAGSRYAESHTLENITEIINVEKKYAFVGKPCDIQALKMYMDDHIQLKKSILYTISFFCAGQPSELAQLKLLKELGCKNTEEILKLTYRGNGWPGYATLTTKSGDIKSMSYNDSWGNILGRDIRYSCRFCLDGIGELSDIACGDSWYLDDTNKPDFKENSGRNIVFARTYKGEKLLKEMSACNRVVLQELNSIDQLYYSQSYQVIRRATMKASLLALKLLGRPIPDYDKKLLKIYSKNVGKDIKIKRFFGVFLRGMKGKL